MGAGLVLGADAKAGEGGAVTVEVHGIASDKGGKVGCALFESSDGFAAGSSQRWLPARLPDGGGTG